MSNNLTSRPMADWEYLKRI